MKSGQQRQHGVRRGFKPAEWIRFGSGDVAQTILSAGSQDIPVPCFKTRATGKSPLPADRNVCATAEDLSQMDVRIPGGDVGTLRHGIERAKACNLL